MLAVLAFLTPGAVLAWARASGRRALPGDDFVFAAPGSGVDRVGKFRRRTWWEDAVTTASLVDVTPHDLRRTFGSLARAAGTDLRYIRKAMGHTSITTTSRIYAHLYDTELDAVADALDRITKGTAT